MLGNLNLFSKPIISKTVNKLISYGLDQEVSDIQLEIILDGSLEVKYKSYGQFGDSFYFDQAVALGVFDHFKDLAKLDKENYSGSFNLNLDGRQVKIEASIIKTGRGEIINLKTKAQKNELLFLDELGLSQNHFDLMEANLYAKGISIISGLESSGKTTTALAWLLACNSINLNVYSLSSNELIKLRGINQVLVKNQTPRDWDQALLAVTKQDADIIYLDEPPLGFDAKILASLSSSKTIIISLKAQSAWEAFNLMAQGNLNSSIAQTKFNLIINQRLARRLCENCCFDYTLDEKVWQDLANTFEIMDQDLIGLKLRHAAGCQHCNHSGYLGQIGLFEMIKSNQSLDSLIIKTDKKTEAQNLFDQSIDLSIIEDGFIKALKGLTTIEELKRTI